MSQTCVLPPRPLYELEDRVDADGTKRQVIWILNDQGQRIPDTAFSNKNFHVEIINSAHKTKLAIMTIRHPKAKHTILFSHGNATDLGAMRDHLIDMAIQLEVNVWAYDYSGYGLSTGSPSPANLLSDADTVYDYMTTDGGVNPNSVILYGQSLGSAATIHLAKQHRTLGVIIHAGLQSALRVIREINSTKWFDIFPNIDLIKKVESPVFVMHGQQDEEIPVQHGINLSQAAKRPFAPWFVDGAGHNNIEVVHRHEYFVRIRDFITAISTNAPSS